ncbi:hypothetical protein PMI41_00822 [Phyllobacterium sp. YR531]|nr:hypothetical protein PMI41_00822 [Phyllobacterium sp. YR531]
MLEANLAADPKMRGSTGLTMRKVGYCRNLI